MCANSKLNVKLLCVLTRNQSSYSYVCPPLLQQPETRNIAIMLKIQFELFYFKRDGLTSTGVEAYLFNNDHSSIGGPTNVWQISTGADYQSKSTVCWMILTDDRLAGKNNISTNRLKIQFIRLFKKLMFSIFLDYGKNSTPP